VAEISSSDNQEENYSLDPLIFGRRLRHARKRRGLTLKEVAGRVGKHAPYLSQVENGKREPNLSLINALAGALEVGPGELLAPGPPSRRSELEIAVERAQADPLWQGEMGLPSLSASAGMPTHVLEVIVRLFEEIKARGQVRAETPEEARKANAALRDLMRERNNYFAEIEALATETLDAIGYAGGGPVSQRAVGSLAGHFGFSVHSVQDLPTSVRSVTDLRNRRIYIPQRDRVGARLAGSVVIQTLGHFALGHEDPGSFGEFLRQRIEANYFAGAILIPERAAVPALLRAKRDRELGVEDLEEAFNVSYEMAAHRFTNLATQHLGIPVHFLRSDEEGVIWKAYANDGFPFPSDADGAIEGQLVCRELGAAQVFGSEHKFSVHYQHTQTNAGAYWSATYLEVGHGPMHAVTIGAGEGDSRYFRGRDTDRRARSRCPEGPCCRRPSPELALRWSGRAWPSPRPHSHVLAALPAGTFPGVDLPEIYEFLERHSPD
jgi:XRE family transcriptional regulator, fatty acid utilization regulator